MVPVLLWTETSPANIAGDSGAVFDAPGCGSVCGVKENTIGPFDTPGTVATITTGGVVLDSSAVGGSECPEAGGVVVAVLVAVGGGTDGVKVTIPPGTEFKMMSRVPSPSVSTTRGVVVDTSSPVKITLAVVLDVAGISRNVVVASRVSPP